ncbi:MAG: beta-L-arabinofuranosidase domain-containing protein [Mucilaginibacter sp.]
MRKNLSAGIIACMLLPLLSLAQQKKFKASAEPAYSKYSLFSPVKITPEGWLRTFLQYQKSGLTGHIENAGYPFNTVMWTGVVNDKMEDRFWWPYEQSGYFIDGCIKAGYLLQDTFLINKAKKQVDFVLNKKNPDGRLGPQGLKGRWNRWPYAGFLRSFMTEYAVTRNPKIIEAMKKHYATYKGEDFADELDLANAEEICWLYGITGDAKLLQKAEIAYTTFKSDHKYRDRDGRDIIFASDRVPDYHGVVYIELVKIPAILYSYTGKKAYLDEALNGIAKMEKYDMLASGIPSSNEHFNGISEMAGHETCNLATIPYTYGYMLQVTGDATWADKIEKAVFNGGIGAITKDFKQEQYFSAPNQFIATFDSNHLGYQNARMAFLPGHDTECCTGNVNRFMPYYIQQMWLQTKNGGVAASLYGASEIKANVGAAGVPVKIVETTKYPFEEAIAFEVQTKKSVKFPFRLRIPAWCANAAVSVNGKKVAGTVTPGQFFEINRLFANGDKITLSLPMEVKVTKWPNNGVGVERGPIVYSYPIAATVDTMSAGYKKATKDFPGLGYSPAHAWNYALAVNSSKDVQVIKNTNYTYPWAAGEAPVRIKVPAQKLKNWKLNSFVDTATKKTLYQTSPFPANRETMGDKEDIELVPYGSTLLRVTVFPKQQ